MLSSPAQAYITGGRGKEEPFIQTNKRRSAGTHPSQKSSWSTARCRAGHQRCTATPSSSLLLRWQMPGELWWSTGFRYLEGRKNRRREREREKKGHHLALKTFQMPGIKCSSTWSLNNHTCSVVSRRGYIEAIQLYSYHVRGLQYDEYERT